MRISFISTTAHTPWFSLRSWRDSAYRPSRPWPAVRRCSRVVPDRCRRSSARRACISIPTDIDSIASAIRGLLIEPDRRDVLARRALEQSRLFTWDASARALLDCFAELEHGSHRKSTLRPNAREFRRGQLLGRVARDILMKAARMSMVDPFRLHGVSATMKPQLNFRVRMISAALAALCVGSGLGIDQRAQAQEKSAAAHSWIDRAAGFAVRPTRATPMRGSSGSPRASTGPRGQSGIASTAGSSSRTSR